ncbi:MAG: MmcQ/YjbR family DNA-binding protein [Clostridia bacterium]|nr:MmcQ/YjbR family DNA-binding protein [Clostridia bacterium]MBR1704551.1 MmcQ/YjbR family DNA-binding protein [Clostridia bacterium]
MSIESDFFRRMEPKFDSLEPYGFVRAGEAYVYQTEFQEGAFRAEVTVREPTEHVDGEPDVFVTGRVMDTDLQEEYMPLRSPTAIGAFVGQVRENYAAILGDIAEQCFRPLPFLYDQSNRIARRVRKAYGDDVERTFRNNDDVGVFRDLPTKKWYGIVMTVSKARLERLSEEKFAKDRGEKLPPEPKGKRTKEGPKDYDARPEDEIEILNVKLDPVKIPLLEKADGFYPCYHMNRNHWITVALDGRVSDDYIMELIQESHALSIRKPKTGAAARRVPGEPLEWFVPANPKYYDVEAAFSEQEEIFWHQGGKFEVGDIAYMYVGAPRSSIMYKCVVTGVDCGSYTNHNGKQRTMMLIKKLEEYPPDLLPWSEIKHTGLGTAQGIKYITPKLRELIVRKLEEWESS